MNSGFLYAANGKKYILEAEISARSVRRHSKQPIALITDAPNYVSPVFDHIIYEANPVYNFSAKIHAIKRSPFDQTLFLDSDTFCCGPIDEVWELLADFDLAVAHDPGRHCDLEIAAERPEYVIKHRSIYPEFNTGVIGIRKSPDTAKFLESWTHEYNALMVKNDQASFRRVVLQSKLRVAVLPAEYNFRGLLSMIIAHDRVKIIHERMGEIFLNLRTRAASYDEMESLARKLNSRPGKRLFVMGLGIFSSRWTPFYLKRKLKRMIGIKMKSKKDTT